MGALGHYRFVLHPQAAGSDLEAILTPLQAERLLQLTRVTSGFDQRLLEVRHPRHADEEEQATYPRPEYVWEVSVHTVGGGHQYDFERSADRVQAAVAEVATLVAVESFRPVTGEP